MALRTNLKDMTSSRLKLRRQITLLSHGYSAPTAFPDGRITVYPWDTDVDAWATERATRGNQGYMWDLLKQLCDLNGCPLDKFVVGDVSTVLLVARALAHNNMVAFQATCPECAFKHAGQIKVPDQLERLGEKSTGYPGFDTITLEECGDVVKIRPLLIGDMNTIDGRPESLRQKVADRLCRILVPVVDVNDSTPDTFDELVTWWNALSPADKRSLTEREDELYPHLGTDLQWKCDRCAAEFQFPLVFNEKFFRRDVRGNS